MSRPYGTGGKSFWLDKPLVSVEDQAKMLAVRIDRCVHGFESFYDLKKASKLIQKVLQNTLERGVQAGFQCGEDKDVLGGKEAAMELAKQIVGLKEKSCHQTNTKQRSRNGQRRSRKK